MHKYKHYGFIHENDKNIFWKFNGKSVQQIPSVPDNLVSDMKESHASSCAGILVEDGTKVSLPLGAIRNKVKSLLQGRNSRRKRLYKSRDQQKKAYLAFCVCKAVQTFDSSVLSETLQSLRDTATSFEGCLCPAFENKPV